MAPSASTHASRTCGLVLRFSTDTSTGADPFAPGPMLRTARTALMISGS
jgi:hypothetical protein